MLKVLIGYYDFYFPEESINTAFAFAKMAHDHISEEDRNREVSISFLNETEEEE